MENREMKDSGVEWIGKIPKHWEVMTLKRSTISVKGGIWGEEEKKDGNDIPCVRITDFDRSNYTLLDKELILRNLPQEKQKDYILNKGDLLIEKSGGGAKTPVGQVVIYNKDYPAIYTNFTAKIEINKQIVSSEYFNYLNATLYNLGITVRSIKQTTGIQNLDLNNYLMEKASFPTIEEQQKIAAFLDEKAAHIDNIIEDTKKSIENLKAYKQSLITETVTKGLNPNVDMKDSGVEYIGKIPSHWKFSKFKYLLTSPLKYGANESGVVYDDSKPRYIRITDILEGNKLINSNRQSLNEDTAKEYILKDGDLLFARSGATAGKTYMVNKNTPRSAFAGYLIKADVGDIDVSNYVYYYTLSKSYEEWKNSVVIQATIQNIGAEKYGNMFLPIPPKDEQIDIVEYLNKKIKSIDLILEDKKLLLSEFESYKKSLIYEYVTGKKEVK